MRDQAILWVSLPLAALVIFVSSWALLSPGFYSAETFNWQVQASGQDLVDLFLVVPCLLVSSVLAYRKNRAGMLIWGGTVLYTTYTFVIYCFAVHFNELFVCYCLCLGLSFYSFLYFLFLLFFACTQEYFESHALYRVTGFYFILVAILFYFLWLAEIVPSILQRKVPKSLVEMGLLTNAVQVLDLSVVLPALFITGLALLRKKFAGLLLAPAFLTFFVLMDLTIGFLSVSMKTNKLATDLSVAFVMGALALLSSGLLVAHLKNMNVVATEPISP